MRNNPLDDIVKCNIDISSPGSSDATFDSILIVVPAPPEPKAEDLERPRAISKADDLLEYGFTTDSPAYEAATVAFSQSPAPSELYFCVPKWKDGEKDQGYEELTLTLARANEEVSFYGFHITAFCSDGDREASVEWAEANEKLFGFEWTGDDVFPLKNTSYYRSFAVYCGDADGYGDGDYPDENCYSALAWMAKCFGYDPGTETWNLKECAAIVPSRLSASKKKELESQNINMFLRYAGANCFIGGKTLAGEWIDVIRFRDWIKNEIQIRIFNVLKVNRKVPFTDAGIGLIEGTMDATLKDGQDIGGIAPTEYDDDGNPIYGYTISVPKAADLTEADRKSRKLTKCKWSARLAGAIHAVEISGTLTF